MKIMQVFAVALLLVACSPDGSGNLGVAAAAGTNPAAGTLHVQPVEIMDRQGFERPMPAATALVPVGWRTEGGIVWNLGGCVPRTTNWSATSPDGNQGIAVLPSETWKWSNHPSNGGPCPLAQITSIRAYLEDLVRRMHPGARVIDFRNRPDLAQALQYVNAVTPMPDGELRNWVEAGEVLVGYTNQNGVEIRKTISTTVGFFLSRMGMPDGSMLEELVAQSVNTYAVHAPSGQLDFRAGELLRRTIQPAPEWAARIANADAADAKNTTETYAAISRVNARESAKRLAMGAEASRYVADVNRAGWEFRNANNDDLQRKVTDALVGVQAYVDPTGNTGEVKLDYGYKKAWRLDDGTYVLTDNLMFEPYKYTGQYGTQLQVKK